AQKIGDTLQSVPAAQMPEAALEKQREYLKKVHNAILVLGIKAEMRRAQNALARGKTQEALDLLEPVEAKLIPEVWMEYELLKATALYRHGQERDAMEVLDNLDEVPDPRAQRIYGILLAKAGRGEGAEILLEGLPLNLFNSAALEALLMALEQQGKWEALLGRLMALHSLPERFRPVLLRSCAALARRKLRHDDPEGALDVFRSYLSEADLTRRPASDVYMEALLRSNKIDEATRFILKDGAAAIGSIPPHLLSLVKDKASRSLSEELRFRLYMRLKANHDPDVEEELASLWPRYGSYMLEEGNYLLQYRKTQMSSPGSNRVSSEDIFEQKLTWIRDRFLVQQKGEPDEEWWLRNGILHRKNPEGELLLPLRIIGIPPFTPLTSYVGVTKWTAEIIGTNEEISAADRYYPSCMRVRLAAEDRPSTYIDIFYAPEGGEVLREYFRNDGLYETWELLDVQQHHGSK
ncbi:MAG: hypothetical protein V3T77_10980, partial [Planctomycetota bacterium]